MEDLMKEFDMEMTLQASRIYEEEIEGNNCNNLWIMIIIIDER